MRSIRTLLKDGAAKLRKSSPTPVLDAELILLHVLHKHGIEYDKIKLITRSQEVIEADIAKAYDREIQRRSKGLPVQYITNTQEFMGLKLFVSDHVLIPRPDTETLVERVLALAKNMEAPCIMDMCTGSGAIAVSLAHYLPKARVYGTDISQKALDCCRQNIINLNLENRVTAVYSDLFKELQGCIPRNSLDIIVSNPPYIETGEISRLSVSVREYEPVLALDGGGDGLRFYRQIIEEAPLFLKPKGILAFEIGYNQGEAVKALLQSKGFTNINIEKDLAEMDRCVWAIFEDEYFT